MKITFYRFQKYGEFISCKILWVTLLLTSIALSDTIWVDCILPVSSTTTYSFEKRDNTGSDGKAYKSLHDAIGAMTKGTHLVLRDGTYPAGGQRYTLPRSINGTSWDEGFYNEIRSADDEWAIIDGENKIPTVDYGYLIGNSNSLNYWKFERLEFTRATRADGKQMLGFYANAGPFIFRYCYFHDNNCDDYNNNPTALGGKIWNNSLIEYCYFKNNGSFTTLHHNISHIKMYGDYRFDEHTVEGFTYLGIGEHEMKNEIRYNLFEGGSMGFRVKALQAFTGRVIGNGYNDTYKEYGDKVHNNIFIDLNQAAIECNQDFMQVYNNIIYNCSSGIVVGELTKTMYKQCIYNNTIRLVPGACIYANQGFDSGVVSSKTPEPRYYGWVVNNIVDSCTRVANSNFEEIATYVKSEFTSAIQDSLIISNNYIYRPPKHAFDAGGVYHISLKTASGVSRYTVENWAGLQPSSKLWSNQYVSSNTLFQHTNPDSIGFFKTAISHLIKNTITIANGGLNRPHWYLKNVSLPPYIGATDPNDPNNNQWVEAVLNLRKLGGKWPPIFLKPPTIGANIVFADSGKKRITWVVISSSKITVCSLYVSYDSLKTWKPLAAVKDDSQYDWKLPDTSAKNTFLKGVAIDSYAQRGSAVSSRISIIISGTPIIRRAQNHDNLENAGYVFSIFTLGGRSLGSFTVKNTFEMRAVLGKSGVLSQQLFVFKSLKRNGTIAGHVLDTR